MEVRRRIVIESGPPIVGSTGARFPSARRRRRWQSEASDEAEPPVSPAEEPAAAPPADPPTPLEKPGKGRARGARFPSEAMLRRWQAEDEPPPAAAPEPAQPDESETADAPVTADGPDAPDGPDTPDVPAAVADAVDTPPVPSVYGSAEAVEPAPRTTRVRPYVLTSGRTRPASYLGVETLVSARKVTPRRRRPLPDLAHRAVVELCGRPRSVAEVASLMRVPLGVARVLIGDLSHSGLVLVHRARTSDGTPDGAPDRELMIRVLDGLRRI